jgi:hypothetical protein
MKEMSSPKVVVNGALIDKDFLDENIREAKRYSWKRNSSNVLNDHAHCMICNSAISEEDKALFVSENDYLCEYCFYKFIFLESKASDK